MNTTPAEGEGQLAAAPAEEANTPEGEGNPEGEEVANATDTPANDAE